MAALFEELVGLGRGALPSQQAFVDRLREACVARDPSYREPATWPGVDARLRRTHAALVRERHLLAMLEDGGLKCTRSAALDMEHAADIVVFWGRSYVQLATFQDTPRAWEGWERKRRAPGLTGLYLAVPLYGAHHREVNGYWLYSEAFVHAIRSEVQRLADGAGGSYSIVAPGALE